MQSFTVNDLAGRIRRPGEDLRVAGDRVRNWTRAGLLSVAGEKNPGTGKSRLYRKVALVEAVLLQVLTDSTGVGVGNLGPILREAKKHLVPLMSGDDPDDAILIMSRSAGEEWTLGSGRLRALAQYIASESHDIHTVINVKRMLDRALLPEEN
ncbi:hypothetical protein [Bradyrhizobium elkanii]|uniref:hypothetical protein n=1 Tax=Bradyrhizobium elkanii TaxID=29448 RepID=UPI0005700E53|nr:hypothetical protein [Bradyrhizobium elkanii]WLA78805.1 hypothetical protein QNJ99_25620 [Bradyrhizobium elkanii]